MPCLLFLIFVLLIRLSNAILYASILATVRYFPYKVPTSTECQDNNNSIIILLAFLLSVYYPYADL